MHGPPLWSGRSTGLPWGPGPSLWGGGEPGDPGTRFKNLMNPVFLGASKPSGEAWELKEDLESPGPLGAAWKGEPRLGLPVSHLSGQAPKEVPGAAAELWVLYGQGGAVLVTPQLYRP